MKIVDIIIVGFCCPLEFMLTYLFLMSGGDDMTGIYAGAVGGFITVYMVLYFFDEDVQQVKSKIRKALRKK